MKKFAAIFISVVLAALMVITPVVSAAMVDDLKTAAEARDPQYTGTLELTKLTPKVNDEDVQEGVTGAEFTAYRVLDLNDTGLFTVNSDFEAFTSTRNDGKTLEELLLAADDGLTFRSTEIFGGTGNETTDDGIIPELQYYVEENDTAGVQVVKDNTNDADENGVYLFKDLPLGVYLIVETVIPDGYVATSKTFLVSIPEWDEATNSWNFDIKAKPKDDPIDISKEIVDGTEPDRTTKAIGDNVPYKVTVDIPNYGKLNYALTDEQIAAIKYTITDTMSEGLTYNRDLVVSVYDNAGNKVEDFDIKQKLDKNSEKEAAYTVTVKDGENGATVITVDFDFRFLNQYQGLNLVLEYSATLNEKAVIGVDGNGEANINGVQLEYTNNPRPAYDTPETKKTEKKKTSVFTYGMDVTKTFNGNSAEDAGVDPTGVEFSLSEYDTAQSQKGDKIWFIVAAKKGDNDDFVRRNTGEYWSYSAMMAKLYKDSDDDGVYDKVSQQPQEPEEGKHVKIDGTNYIITQILTPATDSTFVVNGLDVGTYVLTEENSIEGWSKLASDIMLTVRSKTVTSTEMVWDDELETEVPTEVTTIVMETVVSQSKVGSEDANNLTNDADNGAIFTMTINNVEKQFDLPLTGGAGLLAFTIGGGIVIAGAIIIFSMLRKKKAAK